MSVVAADLAAADLDIVFPRLGHTPTVQQYLEAAAYGEKSKVGKAFAARLAICASPSVKGNFDKYRSVLATPMRKEVEKFCNTGAGMEILHIAHGYEMLLSACYNVSDVACLTVLEETD